MRAVNVICCLQYIYQISLVEALRNPAHDLSNLIVNASFVSPQLQPQNSLRRSFAYCHKSNKVRKNLVCKLDGTRAFRIWSKLRGGQQFRNQHKTQTAELCINETVKNPTLNHELSYEKVSRPFPEDEANVISKLFFLWTRSVLRIGNEKVLEVDDLWDLPPSKDVGMLTDKFEAHLEAETSKPPMKSRFPVPDLVKAPLLRALWGVYWKEFLHVGVVRFLNTLIQFGPALLVRRLLRSIEACALGGGVESIKSAYYSALALFAVVTTKTLFENQYFYRTTQFSLGVRAALSAAVYRKSLRLSAGARQNSTVGEIVNLMQLDTGRVETLVTCIHPLWDNILQITGYSILLWYTLGPCAIAGFIVMASLIPINTQFFKRLSAYRQEMLKQTDQRVKNVNEMLQGIRAIKLYNWEGPFKERIESIHNKELEILTRSVTLRSALVSVLSATPAFVIVVTLGLYSWLGNVLSPSTVFTALALFNQLRFPLYFFPVTLSSLADGKVSVNRLTRFFADEEVLPYIQRANKAPITFPDEVALSVKCGAFYWTDDSKESSMQLEPGRVRSSVTAALHGINLCVKKGQLVAVIGTVGSGKSSLMAALLGEMRHLSGHVYVTGDVAYVPQTAWIPNDTIRGNILFGRPFNESKYEEVLRVCSLERDMELLEFGDLTEIGEQGINLSGGQKQRLSIARALYSNADVYFMDDALSALDAQVGQRVFRDCIKGALSEKTRILVTNQLQFLPEVDLIVIMGKRLGTDGQTIVDQGTYQELQERGHDLSALIDTKLDVPKAEIPSKPLLNGHAIESEEVNKVLDLSQGSSEEVEEVSSLAQENIYVEAERGARLAREQSSEKIELGIEGVSEAIRDMQRPMIIAKQIASITSDVSTEEPLHEMYGVWDVEGRSRELDRQDERKDIQRSQKEKSKSTIVKGGLIEKEERATGAVHLDVYRQYLSSAAAPALITITMIFFGTSSVFLQLQQWMVSFWTSDPMYIRHSLRFYLGGVTGSALLVAALAHLRTMMAFFIGMRASRKLHGDMLQRILYAPVSFFDTTPVGRLVQRFSKDTDEVDQQLISQIAMLINAGLSMIGSLAAVMIATPVFSVMIVPLAAVYIRIMNYFRPVARELQRLDSLTRSPVYAHFTETLGGLAPIRAFGHMNRFSNKNERLLETNFRAYLTKKVTDRWLNVRLELLGNTVVLISALLATRAAGYGNLSAGLAGLAITNALSVTSLLNWAVRCYTETETMMNSVQRILYMSNTAQEAPHVVNRAKSIGPSSLYQQHPESEQHIPLIQADGQSSQLGPEQIPDDSILMKTGWPWEGELEFRGCTMRYRSDTELVLKGINLTIQPGEKVGIVGRTGSGKSSLLQVLFRMVELEEGQILIDGVDIGSIGLSALRSRLTIIPQDPVLFSGTIRYNLDPFSAYSNSEVWSALDAAGLKGTISAYPGKLMEQVSEYGENFSVGQRQLICLARALLRKSRVLLLDEATSSVDYETDALIQRTIRIAFKDCTVLTIAHRLNTITDSDRILVLDNGRVAEFDSPSKLLLNPYGLFSKLLASERQSRTLQSNFKLNRKT